MSLLTNFKSLWSRIQAAYRNSVKILELLLEADAHSTYVMALCALVSAVLPVSQAWMGKLIIDSVVQSVQAGRSIREGLSLVAKYLIFELMLILAGHFVSQWTSYLDHIIECKLKHLINVKIIKKALSLETYYFENSKFYDQMQGARENAALHSAQITSYSFHLFQNVVALVGALVVLFSFNSWIAAVLVFASIPAFIIQGRYSQLQFRLQTSQAHEARSLKYLQEVLTLDSAVKEVKLFGLGDVLLGRYQNIFQKIFSEDRSLARKRSMKSMAWGVFSALCYYGGFAWIIFLVLGKKISLGDMTLYLAVFQQSQAVFHSMLASMSRLYENGLFLGNFFGFMKLPTRSEKEPQICIMNEGDSSRGIEFREVGFKYPGSQSWALRGFSLNIKPGEKIALIGGNGAGKTTVLKLLMRLYEPTEGEILFCGRELGSYDVETLRGKMSAIFQDFVHFQSTADENIGFGEIRHMKDKNRVLHAADASGASAVINRLPGKYEAQLGNWFKEGHELSGGEWQKIALARALMRDSEILLLDEPTASFDLSSEKHFLERFKELSAKKTAIVVSHRPTIWNMVDRMVFLTH